MFVIHKMVLCLPCLIALSGNSSQQPSQAEGLVDWGNTKVIDGSMEEWSPLGGLGGHGTVDNEWYVYDTGDGFWNDPQGGDFDEPLSVHVMKDHPATGDPAFTASGFNLWGAYLCFEPYHDGQAIVAALDLPLCSNVDVSPDYVHPYNHLPPSSTIFYPVAFDCDGNGDAKTVNSDDDLPEGVNGYNFIKSGLWFYDDWDVETYTVILCLGDDAFPVLDSTDSREMDGLNLIGLPIIIELRSIFGVILPPTAVIPGQYTQRKTDLDLVAVYGPEVLEVAGHDNPDPHSSPRIVDIEIKVSKLKAIVEDEKYIDWTEVSVGQFPTEDLRIIYMMVKSGSFDDQSKEHFVSGGHVFPELPFKAVVSRSSKGK